MFSVGIVSKETGVVAWEIEAQKIGIIKRIDKVSYTTAPLRRPYGGITYFINLFHYPNLFGYVKTSPSRYSTHKSAAFVSFNLN